MSRFTGRPNPYLWALAYGAIASTFVAGISLVEGTFYHERVVNVGAKLIVQHPYIANFSTILDFAIFNPIAIYYLLKTSNGFASSYAHFQARSRLSPFDRLGLVVASGALGVSAMWFYFRGFVGSTFFTEAFKPTQSGTASISLTGWAIFVATAIFIALVAFVAMEFGNYILFISRLNTHSFRFCLPPNVSRGVEIAIAPCVSAAYVLAALFVVLAIFVFRDFFQFEIRQSWRAWLFAPYILVCAITFLPFWHLHRVMAEQRKDIIDSNNSVIEEDIWTSSSDANARGQEIDPRKLIVSVDKIERMQSFYKSIPTWPANATALMAPNVSVLISVGTLAYKLFDTIRATMK